MKSEAECIERIAGFNEQEYLVLNVASKGWKIKKKDEKMILIPTKKKTCLMYIDSYVKHFKVSKEAALASLESLWEEFKIPDPEKLLAGLFAKECKKAKEIEVLEDEINFTLEEAIKIDENPLPNYLITHNNETDPFSNVDSFYFEKRH